MDAKTLGTLAKMTPVVHRNRSQAMLAIIDGIDKAYASTDGRPLRRDMAAVIFAELTAAGFKVVKARKAREV